MSAGSRAAPTSPGDAPAAATGVAPVPRRREPIRRRKLYEDVSAGIQEMIAGLRPGDRLPSERELMAEFGVGRTAVREAMLALQRAGVVAVSSGERARVARPSARLLLDQLAGPVRLLLAEPGGVERFRDVRVLLEAGLARLAAQRATGSDLAMLADLLAANRHAAAEGAAATFARTDVAFHYALATCARNELLTALLDAVLAWLAERPGGGDGPAVADVMERAVTGHERILAAVAAGDPEGAAAAMQRHLLEGSSP